MSKPAPSPAERCATCGASHDAEIHQYGMVTSGHPYEPPKTEAASEAPAERCKEAGRRGQLIVANKRVDSVTVACPVQPDGGGSTPTSTLQSRLTVVPLTLKRANDFVTEHHRHHGAVTGGLDFFRIGAVDEGGALRAVAIVSRPPNRNSDDGVTCEVVRLASDGAPNACSFLYAAAARVARTMGFVRMMTYTLTSESGISLRAAGWKLEKHGIKSWWSLHQSAGRTVKPRAHFGETKSRWGAPGMGFTDAGAIVRPPGRTP